MSIVKQHVQGEAASSHNSAMSIILFACSVPLNCSERGSMPLWQTPSFSPAVTILRRTAFAGFRWLDEPNEGLKVGPRQPSALACSSR